MGKWKDAAIQKGQVNRASGDDVIGVQAGRIGDGKAKGDRGSRGGRDAEVRVENTRSGNAKVGKQADRIDRIDMDF